MERVTLKFLTQFLTKDQIKNYIKVSLELKNRISNNPHFLKSIITDDKIREFRYDLKTSHIIAMKVRKFTLSKKILKTIEIAILYKMSKFECALLISGLR